MCNVQWNLEIDEGKQKFLKFLKQSYEDGEIFAMRN